MMMMVISWAINRMCNKIWKKNWKNFIIKTNTKWIGNHHKFIYSFRRYIERWRGQSKIINQFEYTMENHKNIRSWSIAFHLKKHNSMETSSECATASPKDAQLCRLIAETMAECSISVRVRRLPIRMLNLWFSCRLGFCYPWFHMQHIDSEWN